MKRPMRVGEQYIEADDEGFLVYEVESVQGELARLNLLCVIDYGERIPSCFQGLPLFDSR